jgi:PIN domain nuclease of toxin-antitoxin system
VKYLLDTCVLLWALEDNKAKISSFVDILQNPKNYIAVSVVSYWEIAIKKSLGKLSVPNDLLTVVEESGFAWINLETKHIEQLEKLPLLHNDPFDRLLIAQANADGFKLLSVDQMLLQYYIPT